MIEDKDIEKQVEKIIKRIATEDNEAGAILRGHFNIPSIEAAREIFSTSLNESH